MLPFGDIGGGRVTSLGNGNTVRDASRDPRVRADLAARGLDGQYSAAPGLPVFPVVREVAEPVGDEGGADMAGAEHAGRVTPYDDVGAGSDQGLGEILLLRRRALRLLGAPMQKHDERVDLGPHRAYRGDEACAVNR